MNVSQTQSESKSGELAEQRKVLVKEVKSLRKQSAEDKQLNAQLTQVNQEVAGAYEVIVPVFVWQGFLCMFC